MTTSPESSAENPAAKPAAKSAQLRGRTEPHKHSFNMPQREPIEPYERPSYPFFYVPTDLLIGGSWVIGDNGSFPVHNPSCGQILAHVADASVEQGIEALDAACEARTLWAATSVRERADILNRAYTLMTQRTEVIAWLMTLEMGKPLDQSRGEVAYAANYLRWYAEEAARNFGRTAIAPRIRAADHHRTPPRRSLPAHHPLEFPARYGGTQGRPGARGGLHRGAQTCLPDPVELPVLCLPDA